MAFWDSSCFDEDTRKNRLRPAAQLASERGDSHVDFEHLAWIDICSQDSLLRRLIKPEEGTHKTWEEFKTALATHYLRDTHHGGESVSSPEFSKDMIVISQAFRTRRSPDGHNLERILETVSEPLEKNEAIHWADLLSAILDYRPHRLVSLFSDFGLTGSMLDAPRGRRELGQTPASVAAATESLKNFTIDLTSEARAGKISDVVGREEEIRRVITVLGRKEGNNPLLLGDAGVGKTKIVEGLALRIVEGSVHRALRDKVILSLDLGLLIAGAQYRGQFEDRLKALLRDLKEARGHFILFVDEIHQLLGLGRTSGAMDAANLMKPALARGELWCIGATTYSEYMHFEHDAALRRRFEPIDVRQQAPEQINEILKRVAPIYEKHHRVKYSDLALSTLSRMARRYIGDIASPAREVGLMDEIGSELSLSAGGELNSVLDVRPEHISAAISRRTGIPLQRMTADRKQRILSLEGSLNKRVFGQELVIGSVSKVLRRSLVGLANPARPRGLFLFTGPSGVGKTELAKAIAEEMYDAPQSTVVLDMSEFSAETARNRLIGADPGFVGYEEGGRLTEAVRRLPYSLIILDEFEKAHPTVWRLFLQVFDEGRLTDAKGRVVSFKETVIVMTSNVGAELVAKTKELRSRLATALSQGGSQLGKQTPANIQDIFERTVKSLSNLTPRAYEILSQSMDDILSGKSTDLDVEAITQRELLAIPGFPAELFSRIGRPLVFKDLGPKELSRILDRLLLDLCVRIAIERRVDIPSGEVEQQRWFKIAHGEDGRREAICANPDHATEPDVIVILGSDLGHSLIANGYDSVLGARSLREMFEVIVETAVAERLLIHDEGMKVKIEVGRAEVAVRN